jgi:aminomethyltransferase
MYEIMKAASEAGAGSDGYRALSGTLALIEEPRAIFRVQGARAYRVVNGLVTNSIEGIARGTGSYAFSLSAKGRPIAEMRVLPSPGFEAAGTDERVWLDVPIEAAASFRDLLARTVPPIFATIDEPEVARFSIAGPVATERALEVIRSAGLVVPGETDPRPLHATTCSFGDETALLVGREEIEAGGVDVYVPRVLEAELREALSRAVVDSGGAVASLGDWEMVRVEYGLPRYGAEITEDNLPQETGQTERAISFEKGCYTGQEVVARLHYRGHVNRVLRGLRPVGDAAEWFGPGVELEFEGRRVGSVSTTVSSPRLGPVGLGYVRTSVEPGTIVPVSGLSRGPSGAPTPPDETGARLEVLELPFTFR